ncbi:DUF1175 family protein [Bryobacter aggregatus]|uniref:DUF1175 family protein n=1 Tax=Bryobacter aggregatus TaxID=360054 RepID=UPI000690B38C|nr:DUF1175 family protein [Bryobacter aggregatus]
MYWIVLLALAFAPRLEDPADRTAFRLWFTFLAESQFYVEPGRRPREIQDCASLLRYAYRESFAKHDAAWMQRNVLPGVPGLPAIRTRSGPLFLTSEGMRHFADAKTLMRENCVRVGATLDRAKPGDLLFYEQLDQPDNWHVMIYLGASQIEPDGDKFVVYHTGPIQKSAGEIRKLRVSELLGHPQPRWRPVPGNGAFKGVYRWKILEG